MSSITSRITNIRERIKSAAEHSSRWPESVTLVGVTKTRSAADALEVLKNGISDLGENRVQEAQEKFPQLLETCQFRKHLIGHLQTNKARQAAELFDLIHSVDSVRLAVEINKHSAKIGKIQDILLEINVSGEASKHGMTPEQVTESAGEILHTCSNLRICGFMTMAPFEMKQEDTRPVFRGLKTLSEQLQRHFPQIGQELSMGMTNDFEIAVEEGATLVRIGTALFVD